MEQLQHGHPFSYEKRFAYNGLEIERHASARLTEQNLAWTILSTASSPSRQTGRRERPLWRISYRMVTGVSSTTNRATSTRGGALPKGLLAKSVGSSRGGAGKRGGELEGERLANASRALEEEIGRHFSYEIARYAALTVLYVRQIDFLYYNHMYATSRRGRRAMAASKDDIVGGTLLSVLGAGLGLAALNLRFGTSHQMGPGFFPLVLAAVVGLLGIAITIRGLIIPNAGSDAQPIQAVHWRGIILVIVAPISFGLTVKGFGFLPAIWISSLAACFASRAMTIRLAVMTTVVLSAFCAAVFIFGLRLPLRLFGPYLAG